MKRPSSVDPSLPDAAESATARPAAAPKIETELGPPTAVESEPKLTVDPAPGGEPADRPAGVEPIRGQPDPTEWGGTSTSLASGSPLTADDLEAALERLGTSPVAAE